MIRKFFQRRRERAQKAARMAGFDYACGKLLRGERTIEDIERQAEIAAYLGAYHMFDVGMVDAVNALHVYSLTTRNESLKRVREIVAEWRKGCSNGPDCEACAAAAMSAIERDIKFDKSPTEET